MDNKGRKSKVLNTARKILLAAVWLSIIVFCFIHRDDISVEAIANYTPRSPLLAALVMLALFALKSMSIVLYSGLLYAANGILFPLPVAVVLNILGTFIMVSIPYWVGRRSGASAAEQVRAKYPKAEKIHELRAKNDFIFTFLVRMLLLPSDVASLYMGAIKVDHKKYLLGSVLGMLPHTLTYPIMGMSLQDIRSPQFLISLCADILYTLLTTLAYAAYRKKNEAVK